MKKTVFWVLVVLLISFLACGVLVAQSPSVQNEKVEAVFTETRSNLIWKGISSLTDWGNLYVSFYGSTDTFSKVDYLSGRTYLQRWNGSRWVNVSSRLFYRENHTYAAGGRSLTVTPGLYRVYTIHYADHNGVSDTQYTYTNAKYISKYLK